MKKMWNIAVVGATGALGNEILRVLEDRDFPVGSLRLLDTDEGEDLEFQGESIFVQALSRDSFEGIDLAFFCAGEEYSREFCPLATAAGALCIDLSRAWRMDPDVPLIVPEVNPNDLSFAKNKGIIAIPGSLTIQTVLSLEPIHRAGTLRRVVVSTYQSVSDKGQPGIDELRVQCGELLNGRPAAIKVFPHQVAFNCIPHAGEFGENGYTADEVGLVKETRKVLGKDDLPMTATAVRVPVFYGHGAAMNVETVEKVTPDKVRELLSDAPGVEVVDDVASASYPMVIDAAGEDVVHVGRIREDHSVENGLHLWAVADNLRKGGAVPAVQIAELLAEQGL